MSELSVPQDAVGQDAVSQAAAPQDWELLASPGHVLGQRMAIAMRKLFLPACLAFAISIVAAQQVLVHPIGGLPEWLARMIPSYDPATFVKVPGGGTTSWQLTYLSALTPQPGLDRAEFKLLTAAAHADIEQFGDNTQLWQAVGNLDRQPLVTRPQKVFGSNAAKLGSGMIVLPQGYKPDGSIWVVAWVDGRLTWAELARSGCHLLLGSASTAEEIGCASAPELLLDKVYDTPRFSLFRPAAATAQTNG